MKQNLARCLSDAWRVGSSCFSLLPGSPATLPSLAAARSACQADGGILAVLPEPDLYLELWQANSQSTGNSGWVSLERRNATDVDWVMSDGSRVLAARPPLGPPVGARATSTRVYAKIGITNKLHMAGTNGNNGAWCQYAMNGCDSSSCENGGLCVNDAFGAMSHCNCPDSHTGTRCQTEFAPWLLRLKEMRCWAPPALPSATACEWRFV